MTTRADVAVAAQGWVGTPFKHQAALRGVGCDCMGLVYGVAQEKAIPGIDQFLADPSLRVYGRMPDAERLLAGCDRFLDRIPIHEAGVGDVLLMAFESEPRHFAVVSRTCPLYIVHALAQARRVVEHRLDELWASRIVRAYRVRGIDG